MSYQPVKELIFGVDMHPFASPLSKPVYSLAVVNSEGRVERCFKAVSLTRILKLARRFKPSSIATDNLYELAENNVKLSRIAASLPDGIKLVQVTGPPNSLKPLELIAREYGFKVSGKLNPLDTAKLVAKLAWLGAGYTVKLYGPETIITVSKARATTAGGMSQARFKRELRSLVLQATNRVKQVLSGANIDYDLYERKSKYGLDRSTFIAYAPKPLLRKLLKSIALPGVYVKITSPSMLSFNSEEGLKVYKRYLIVGIDPGVVTGLAALSLDGALVALLSGKTLTRGTIIRRITSYGSPLVVASDVPIPPDLVRKLASALNAVLYTPEQPLSVSDKLALVQDYGYTPSNSHERDALAAAIKAYSHYRNKLEQVEAHVKEAGLRVSAKELEELKAMVVKGISIQQAIDTLQPSEEVEIKPPPPQDLTILKREVEILRKRVKDQLKTIEDLERDNARLRQHIATLNSKVESLELELQKLREGRSIEAKRDAQVQLLELKASQLQRDLNEAKASLEGLKELVEKWKRLLTRILKREVVMVKRLKALTMSAIKDSVNAVGIYRDDVVLVMDATSASIEAAEALAKLKISCLIAKGSIPEDVRIVFRRSLIPVLSVDEVNVEWLEDLPYAEAAPLKVKIEELKARIEEEEAVKTREALRRMLKERTPNRC